VLAAWLPFPHGMAATNRVRLLGRALVEAGADVHVLCLQAGERPGHVANTEARGLCDGISFEYAAGTTVRHDSFAVRRVIEAIGWTRGIARLVRLRRQGKLDIVYLWFTSQRLQLRRLAYLTLLKALGVPVIAELNERPWPLRETRTAAERLLSPLRGVAGVVAISGLLSAWAGREAGRLRRDLRVVEVPIVVDVSEQTPAEYPLGPPLVVFASSADYGDTASFVLAAMQHVWRAVPACHCVITGLRPEEPAAARLATEARRAGGGDRIELSGYLSRDDLLALYGRAHALLIPLFDDTRSRARFPTKIGEYLAAGRPIVTTAVGEVASCFSDGVDALICPPGDPRAYGEKIAAVFADGAAAAAIGRAGRRLAETRFHYGLYSETLLRSFATVAASGGSR
jgi:glycosyltransferase involved in cell wall biosynthesis